MTVSNTITSPDWGEPQASPTVTCWLGFLSRYIYIYIYIDRPTAVFDPAPGVKVGRCGQDLRVVTLCDLCENDILYWYMFHICLQIRHWSNFSEFRFCIRLTALNRSAKKMLGLRKSQRSRDFLLPQGHPASKHVLLSSDLLAHRKSLHVFDKTTPLLLLAVV